LRIDSEKAEVQIQIRDLFSAVFNELKELESFVFNWRWNNEVIPVKTICKAGSTLRKLELVNRITRG